MGDSDSHLKELILTILDEREKAGAATARTLEIRLEKLNELRKEVTDDRASFVKREVYDQMVQTVVERINKIEAGYARIMGAVWVFVLLVGIFSAVIGAVVSHILK